MTKNKKGLTLIEMLVYISIFIAVSDLAYTAFFSGFNDLEKVAFSLYEQQNIDMLVDRIRLDINNSQELLSSFLEYKTGENCLILSSNKNGEDLITIYFWDGTHVVRLEGSAGDKKLSRTSSTRLDVSKFNFTIEKNGSVEYVKGDLEIQKRISHRNRKNIRLSFIEAPSAER